MTHLSNEMSKQDKTRQSRKFARTTNRETFLDIAQVWAAAGKGEIAQLKQFKANSLKSERRGIPENLINFKNSSILRTNVTKLSQI